MFETVLISETIKLLESIDDRLKKSNQRIERLIDILENWQYDADADGGAEEQT